jgi:hypothetical protein
MWEAPVKVSVRVSGWMCTHVRFWDVGLMGTPAKCFRGGCARITVKSWSLSGPLPAPVAVTYEAVRRGSAWRGR